VGVRLTGTALRKLHPADWETRNYDRLLAHQATFDAVLAGKPAAELEKGWQPELERFKERRKAALLYPE
jgi:hypothetical protein